MDIIIIEDKEKEKDKGDVDSSSNVFLNIRKTVDIDTNHPFVLLGKTPTLERKKKRNEIQMLLLI